MNNGKKVVLILIIIALAILAFLGTIYYVYHSRVRLLYLKSEEKFKIGTSDQIKQGIGDFRELAVRFPRSKYAPMALYQIGYGYELLYNVSKDEDKLHIAQNEYYNVYKSYPDSLAAQKALYQIAYISFVKGEYEDSQERLDYLLSRYIDTSLKSQIYNRKGYIYLALGEVEKALKFFSQKENYNSDEALLGKAECYFRLGEYEKGIMVYEEFIKYRKTSNLRQSGIEKFLDNTYRYAKILTGRRDYIRSTMLYQKIINLLPGNKLVENCLYWIGENFYDVKDYDRAIEYFNRVVDNPGTGKDDDALFKTGICYFELHKYEESLKYFRKILDYYAGSTYRKMARDWERQCLRELKYKR
ncbi:MAG: tetratricopeptide repeat protein [Spirochaetes bacterium]|nr:tetratricopeptide repeat protein [Spirochaetota bacterium]